MSPRNRIVPKYFQVEQLLRARVSSLPPGSVLPSEPELAKAYDVSRATLRVAVDALAADGLVTRVQGRGTFVSQRRLDIPMGYKAARAERAAVKPEKSVRHQLTSFERPVAAPELCELFGLEPGERVLRVERITYKDNIPLGFGSLALPALLARGLKRSDFEQGRFFYTLVDHGVRIARYRLVVESSIIPAVLAETLGVRGGLPAIGLTRTGFDTAGKALARVEILTRGDIGRYVLESAFDANEMSMNLALAS